MNMKRLVLCSLFMLSAIVSFAQQLFTSKGVVVDETGETVIGATVQIAGDSKLITVTDADGHFTLGNVKPGSKMEISYVGMKTFSGIAKPEMKVTLVNDNSTLDEIVVTAFGEQKRSAFTGSAAIVDSKKMEQKQLNNVMSSLKGEAAGVQIIDNSGEPGATPAIRVRGFSSISAGQSPLIIVDGAPYDGGWNNINPADVASVTVLKDASSTALYGARGANGVIMVTTKRAQAGNARITVDMKWGANTRIKRDYETISDPALYYETYYKALYNYQTNGLGLTPSQAVLAANEQLVSSGSVGGLGYSIFTVPNGEQLIGADGRMNPHATLGRVIDYNGKRYTILPDDWQGLAFRNGLRKEYDISLTGGSDKMQYYLSLGYLNNEGIAYNSDFKRITVRSKADYEAFKWLKVGTNMNFARAKYHVIPSDGNGLFYQLNNVAPIYPAFIRDGEGNIMTDENGQLYDYGNGDIIGLRRPILPNINPLQENELNTNSSKNNMYSFYGYADFMPIDGLKMTVNGTITSYDSRGTETKQPFYGYSHTAYPTGFVSRTSDQTYSYNFQQLINYNRDFGHHHMELLFGHEFYRYRYESLWGSKTGMASYFSNQTLSGAIKMDSTGESGNSEYQSEGFFFRGQYDYDQKYFGSLSYRRDASSCFAPGHRWGDFYSFGGAWIMTKEKFMKPFRWLNVLKLKGSFGQQGNDKIGDFHYLDTYSIVNINNKVGLVLTEKGNPNITWETNNNFNTGLDFELFNSRLRGSIEYFYKKTTDMLCFVFSPTSAGYKGMYDNIGDMVNKGLEIDLSATVLKTKDLSWDVNLNATTYKNKITKLADPLKADLVVDGHPGYSNSDRLYAEGLPIYTWYMPRYAGVSSEGKSMWYYNDSNGELKATDVYGNASYYSCGDPHPDVYGGFGTTLNAYGFDFSISFSYSLGGKSYDNGYAGMMGVPNGTLGGGAIHKDALNAWSADNPTSTIPRWQYDDANTNAESDRFLISGSYLTLQNINFGYTLPKLWVNRIGLENVRIYIAADNVYYWSKRKGFDPRGSFSGGSSTASYSPTRTVSGGIKLTF
ncbi:SusC/RagA family TonB-linked outer membrane protein [Prevotella multiformis]|uniref:SusC/RagA family TonB-linked outer membrane protein n=1 Tax=Prevotella multiformis TaxID=282402 RepID=UPI0023F40329|nr:TonB-dependent receptor [Prevotella multiformis]